MQNQTPVVKLVRRLAALPLLKLEDIDAGYEYARLLLVDVTEPNVVTKMEEVLQYARVTWVDPENSRFNRTLWSRFNVEGSICSYQVNMIQLTFSICSYQLIGPRTNNHVEGWHSALNKSVARAHPNIFKFIDLIKQEQKKAELKLLQIETGGKVVQGKKKYIDMERNVQAAIATYTNNQGVEAVPNFLDEVGIYLHL